MNKNIKNALYIFLILFIITCIAAFSYTTSIFKSFSPQSQSDNTKPNIIIILADDAGYADFGFMGSEDIQTPNLDAIARDGVVFSDAHVTASVCSPSRAGLLTGRYQQRFGHECNLEPEQSGAFDSAQVTIAEYLKNKNYSTSIFGKWHLGEKPHQHPLKNGFDYFWGFLAGGRSYFPTETEKELEDSHTILENYSPQDLDEYLTDALGHQAASYIEKNAESENPFFMYLSFNAPHTPMHAKEDVLNAIGKGHERPVYAAMVWSMDEAVGHVVKSLKKHGIYDNTLIFFLSDNGGAHNNGSSVKPLKGWKGNQYEGGTRVPFVVTWKDKVLPGNFSGLSSSLDIFQTVAGLWGEKENNLDGVDLVPFLTGTKIGDPHETLFWRKDEMSTVRSSHYKYITVNDTLSVMYDLATDLGETQNIQTANADLANELQMSLLTWKRELRVPLWKEPEDWNAVTRHIYHDLMNNQEPLIKSPGNLRNTIGKTTKNSLSH